jgi:O-antigen/teichoic acid export membrane protein
VGDLRETLRLAFNWFARAGSDDERVAQRKRLMLLLAGPLLLAAAGCLLLAEPVVPWLLGAEWAEAAPLVASLAGVAGGMSLLALVKMELLATGRFRALLMLRLAQFAGLATALPLLVVWPALGVRALGIALGVGIAAGVLAGRRAR